jgi:hypothetical protein
VASSAREQSKASARTNGRDFSRLLDVPVPICAMSGRRDDRVAVGAKRAHAVLRMGRPISPWRARRQVALRVLAVAYVCGVWLDGTGTGIPARILPRPAAYFLQVAALFPLAAVATIDYRAQGFVCGKDDWEELDTRPYFPIDSDDKENRFNRVMHFLRDNRPTMHALDAYLVERHNSGRSDDGIPRDHRIGGIRVLSLRIPIPSPGEHLHRVERLPLSAYPEEERKYFYHTLRSTLSERCGERVPGPS